MPAGTGGDSFAAVNPWLRQALIVIVCAALAVWLGIELAHGDHFWPGLAGGFAIAAILSRALALPFDVILTGLVLAGYIVANRGFAQLAPARGLPLLPAEMALLVAGTWRTVQWGHQRTLPFRRDALSLAIVGLILIGTVRFGFDFPRFGFIAARDFAVVYYAVFFFLVQHMAREERARTFLVTCAGGALAALPVAFALTEIFPQFFLQTLTVHGAPLFYYKADLVFAYFSVAIVWWYFRAPPAFRALAHAGAVGLFVWLALSDNRSSQLALAIVLGFLLLARQWKLPALLGGTAAAGLLALAALVYLGQNDWAERKLDGMQDRVRSLTDFSGTRTYRSEESYFKGDNNRFRALWWRTVAVETLQTNPIFGLGFGHDLAGAFLQEYNPSLLSEDFGVRSPHNVFVTFLGRLGVVGLAAWSIVCGLIVAAAWRNLRRPADLAGWTLWATPVIILVSATVGVVLEGPMGAVPFWVVLALASSGPTDEESAAAPAARLRDCARECGTFNRASSL